MDDPLDEPRVLADNFISPILRCKSAPMSLVSNFDLGTAQPPSANFTSPEKTPITAKVMPGRTVRMAHTDDDACMTPPPIRRTILAKRSNSERSSGPRLSALYPALYPPAAPVDECSSANSENVVAEAYPICLFDAQQPPFASDSKSAPAKMGTIGFAQERVEPTLRRFRVCPATPPPAPSARACYPIGSSDSVAAPSRKHEVATRRDPSAPTPTIGDDWDDESDTSPEGADEYTHRRVVSQRLHDVATALK